MLDLDIGPYSKKRITAVRYPRFIPRFAQLEVLRILLPLKTTFDAGWTHDIELWPRSIKKLSFYFDDLFPAIRKLKFAELFPTLEYLTVKSVNSFSYNFLKTLPETFRLTVPSFLLDLKPCGSILLSER